MFRIIKRLFRILTPKFLINCIGDVYEFYINSTNFYFDIYPIYKKTNK